MSEWEPTLVYDHESRAVYLAVKQPATGGVARTKYHGDNLRVDYDWDDDVVGYQFILPAPQEAQS